MACGVRLDCDVLLPCGHHEKIMNRLSEAERWNVFQAAWRWDGLRHWAIRPSHLARAAFRWRSFTWP